MASERAESVAPVRASKPYTASMLRPEPSGPQRHWAFALRPSARDEALQLAERVAREGPRAASAAVGAWLGAAPRVSHDRETPLDPRVDAVLRSLRALPLHPEIAARRDAVLGTWDPRSRPVWRGAEASLMNAAIRLSRLLELQAPALIVERELDALERELSALDGPPPAAWAGPDTDPGPFVELPHAIALHAQADLSLGPLACVLRSLRRAHDGLAPGEPLAKAEARDGEEGEVLARLLSWRVARPEALAGAATALAGALSAVGAGPRARTTKAFDRRAPPALRGDDYVAATEARLREIAADAAQAEREGLTLFSAVA